MFWCICTQTSTSKIVKCTRQIAIHSESDNSLATHICHDRTSFTQIPKWYLYCSRPILLMKKRTIWPVFVFVGNWFSNCSNLILPISFSNWKCRNTTLLPKRKNYIFTINIHYLNDKLLNNYFFLQRIIWWIWKGNSVIFMVFSAICSFRLF